MSSGACCCLLCDDRKAQRRDLSSAVASWAPDGGANDDAEAGDISETLLLTWLSPFSSVSDLGRGLNRCSPSPSLSARASDDAPAWLHTSAAPTTSSPIEVAARLVVDVLVGAIVCVCVCVLLDDRCNYLARTFKCEPC